TKRKEPRERLLFSSRQRVYTNLFPVYTMVSVLPVSDPVNLSLPPWVIVKLMRPFAMVYVPPTTENCVVVVPSAVSVTKYLVASDHVLLLAIVTLSVTSVHCCVEVANAANGGAVPFAETRANAPTTSELVAGSDVSTEVPCSHPTTTAAARTRQQSARMRTLTAGVGRKMREGGLEPPSLSAPDPKSGASASFATLATAFRLRTTLYR